MKPWRRQYGTTSRPRDWTFPAGSRRQFQIRDIRRAVQVVSIGTHLPATRSFAKGTLIEWNDIPAIGQDYVAARKAIITRVEALVQTLSESLKK
jgi:hypothetical protein